MNKTIRLLFCLGLVLFLSSCASGMKFTEKNPSLTAQNPEMGRIFFYRPSAVGAAVQPNVKLNGEVVGEAISHGFFYVDRPAGNYEMVTSTEVDRKLSFVLDKGEAKFIRIAISFGFFVGHVYGELIDKEEGFKEIQECRYIGTDAPPAAASPAKETAPLKDVAQKPGL